MASWEVFLETFTPFRCILLDVTSKLGKTENCAGTVFVGVRGEATESTRWKNLWRQGAMKRRRDRQASLSWLTVDCLPSGLNHDL